MDVIINIVATNEPDIKWTRTSREAIWIYLIGIRALRVVCNQLSFVFVQDSSDISKFGVVVWLVVHINVLELSCWLFTSYLSAEVISIDSLECL